MAEKPLYHRLQIKPLRPALQSTKVTRPPHTVAIPLSTPPIVFVDDEKSYADLMSQMLQESLGCGIAAFTRPLDALSALPTLAPAVVVTDYFMPQINGLEFIRLASAIVPGAAFVLISGHNLEMAEPQLARLSALKGQLAKPFGWRKLADEIMRVWPSHTPAPWPKVASA